MAAPGQGDAVLEGLVAHTYLAVVGGDYEPWPLEDERECAPSCLCRQRAIAIACRGSGRCPSECFCALAMSALLDKSRHHHAEGPPAVRRRALPPKCRRPGCARHGSRGGLERSACARVQRVPSEALLNERGCSVVRAAIGARIWGLTRCAPSLLDRHRGSGRRWHR